MAENEVKVGEYRYTGLQLQRSEGIPIEAARKLWKQSIINEAKKQGKEPAPGEPFIRIEAPCGQVIQYQTFEDIPVNDTPCPCGDPLHMAVRYIVLEAKKK